MPIETSDYIGKMEFPIFFREYICHIVWVQLGSFSPTYKGLYWAVSKNLVTYSLIQTELLIDRGDLWKLYGNKTKQVW